MFFSSSPGNTCVSSYENNSIHEYDLALIRSRIRSPNPCECAEERKPRRKRARDCLSEASSSETPAGLSTAGCPQRSGGTQAPGSPFFGLPYFGEAKKGESPAAATERHQDLAKNAVIESRRRVRRAQPERVEKIRDRAFLGSEPKFPEPSARPAGASLRFAAKL